ncbi:MAG TPA: hypothetical protein VJT49_21815, partial [Amycolatopsis sp.]|uniref:hypothetical protein n=1 Tax=Amycolatopsis sp. TaxID=37632 RepID=UPI002B4623E5
RKRRRARRGKRLAWTAVVLVALLGAGFAVYRWGKATSEHYDADAPATTTTPSAPTVLPEIARVDLSKPFDNTPAQAWGDSVDGLSELPAQKIGGFSAAQVQDTHNKVKDVIHASRLDRRMLEGHDTSAYLVLLAPNEQNRLRPILADRGKTDFSSYVTMFADGFHLLPAVPPRITGRLSARVDDRDELIVHAEYLVGYAFDPGSYGPITRPADIESFERLDEEFVIRTSHLPEKRCRTGARWRHGLHLFDGLRPGQGGLSRADLPRTVDGGRPGFRRGRDVRREQADADRSRHLLTWWLVAGVPPG